MNDDGGFTKSFRRKWRNPVFRNFRDGGIWSYLCDNAAWQDTAVRFCERLVTLRRGQIAVSERFLAEGFCCDRQVIRRLFDDLEAAQMITRQKTHGGTILTLCSYEEYQAYAKDENPPKLPSQTQAEPTPNPNKKEGKEPEEGNLEEEVAPARDDPSPRMLAIWAAELGDLLSVPVKITSERRQQCKLRFADEFKRDEESWRAFCRAIRGSPFLVGDGDRGWKADFDWALKPKNILKVQEGKYRGKPAGNAKSAQQSRELREGLFDALVAGGMVAGDDGPRDSRGGGASPSGGGIILDASRSEDGRDDHGGNVRAFRVA